MPQFPLQNDPQRADELTRYPDPTASRDYIEHVLEHCGKPIKLESLCDLFGLLEPKQRDTLQFRLRAMERDGQLVRDRAGCYGLIEHMDLRRGRVIGHRDGFGFVKLEGGGADWYLSPKQMRTLLPDDKVLVHVRDIRRNGRVEAAVVRVLEEGKSSIVGVLRREGGFAFVVPQDRTIAFDIQIIEADSVHAQDGELVVVELTQRPRRHLPARGVIKEVLGAVMAPGMEIEVALRSFDLPFVWSSEVDAETAAIADEVTAADCAGRRDLTALPLVTIDGVDARDFDDAVHCRPRAGGGWTLWVAIADVSHYVRPDTALDKEAIARGNSVYFPGEVIPMLPEKLSNGLCSLKPKVLRLAMVSEMDISATGELLGAEFYPALIRSHARLTYDAVWQYLSEAEDSAANQALGEAHAVGPHLQALEALYQVLQRQRTARGAIEFETVETRFEFNQQRKIERIVPAHRNEAHRLIEECMILANVAAANFLHTGMDGAAQKAYGIFRNHLGPSPERAANLREFLSLQGLSLGGGEEPTPRDYAELLRQITPREDAEQIQMTLLRSLSQAVYAAKNEGHFGLALSAYSHFTSPIRRYPDLILHRLIKTRLQQQGVTDIGLDSGVGYAEKEITALAEHCCMTERRADQATRDVTDWLKCEFMLDHIGQEFTGTVVSVLSFGLFVRLDEFFVEGLVHVSSLNPDYYHFDAARQSLTGERAGHHFTIGDTLRVKLASVDLDQRKIDYDLIESLTPSRRRLGKTEQTRKKTPAGRRANQPSTTRNGPTAKSGGKGKSGSKGKSGAAKSPAKSKKSKSRKKD